MSSRLSSTCSSPTPTAPFDLLAAVATTLAPLATAPSDAPSPADDEGAAASPPNSNLTQQDALALARAPVLGSQNFEIQEEI